MSELQFKTIITNLCINQSMLIGILKVLGDVEKEEINKLGDIGINAANIIFENIKQMEKKNGK